MRKTLYTIAFALTAVLALSACSALDLTPEDNKSNGAPAGAGPAEEVGSAPEPTSEPTASVTAGPLVKAVQTAVGVIVTTDDNLALYRSDGDKRDRSNCYNACSERFKAYTWTENMRIEGIDATLVGKVQRTDGTWQLTINRVPLYTYAKDVPGEWKGQGLLGTWWLAGPDGKKLASKN